jgi:hypothetical protein
MKKQIEILLVVVLCLGWCGLAEADITVKDWQFLYEQAEKSGDPSRIMIIENIVEY